MSESAISSLSPDRRQAGPRRRAPRLLVADLACDERQAARLQATAFWSQYGWPGQAFYPQRAQGANSRSDEGARRRPWARRFTRAGRSFAQRLSSQTRPSVSGRVSPRIARRLSAALAMASAASGVSLAQPSAARRCRARPAGDPAIWRRRGGPDEAMPGQQGGYVLGEATDLGTRRS